MPESDSSSRGDNYQSESSSHDRQADIRKVAKILRDGGYSYDQSAHLIKKARREVRLSPPDRSSGGSYDAPWRDFLGAESAARPGSSG